MLFRGDRDEISGNGAEEIFTADARDGKRLRQLTFNAVEDSSPNWSPDGSRIALQVAEGGVDHEIYVMNADGSQRTRLTNDPRHDIGPSWSPDGRMIAFTRSIAPGEPGDVWVMNADGTGQRPLTDTPVIEESPDWQPVPALADVHGRRTACGDLSLDAGGIASVVAVRVDCFRALRVAQRWASDKRLPGMRCTVTRHSIDQSAVECAKRRLHPSPPQGRGDRLRRARPPAPAFARAARRGARPGAHRAGRQRAAARGRRPPPRPGRGRASRTSGPVTTGPAATAKLGTARRTGIIRFG